VLAQGWRPLQALARRRVQAHLLAKGLAQRLALVPLVVQVRVQRIERRFVRQG